MVRYKKFSKKLVKMDRILNFSIVAREPRRYVEKSKKRKEIATRSGCLFYRKVMLLSESINIPVNALEHMKLGLAEHPFVNVCKITEKDIV